METLKMSAMYDESEDGGTLFIFGRPDALSEFSQLLHTVNNEATNYVLSDPPARFVDGESVVLKHLNLSIRPELMDIRYIEQTLFIAGEKALLGNIVRQVDDLVKATIQGHYGHNHIDPFGYHPHITPDSTPLIIRALTDDEI